MASRKSGPKGAKKKARIKPRNPVVVPSLGRKSGRHAPDPKGRRREANRAAQFEALPGSGRTRETED